MFGFCKSCKRGRKQTQEPLIVVIDERGQVRSDRSCEPGIRFLDDAPIPPTPASGTAKASENAKPAAKAKSGGWPITTLAFLAVVVGGVALNEAGMLDLERSRMESPVVKEFELTTVSSLRVESFNGPIEVRRGQDGKVRCEVVRVGEAPTEEAARLIAEGILVETNREESQGVEVLTLKVTAPEVQPGFSAMSEIRVEVPADMAIDVKTQNGAVEVRNLNGQVEVNTNNGSIDVQNGQGQYQLTSRNGSVEVEVRDAVVQATTDNGRIEFRGNLAPGVSKLETRNGSIKVVLPPGQAVELDASTSNGRIETNFRHPKGGHEPGKGHRDRKRDRSRHLKSLNMTVGLNPQAGLVLRTSNGSIAIDMNDRD